MVDMPGGRTKLAALASAHGSIDAMKEKVAEALQHKVRDLLLALVPGGCWCADLSDPQAKTRLADAYRKADGINSLAGLIGHGQVGGVMLLLCDLLHNAGATGQANPLAVEIYRLCTRRMERLSDIGDLTEVTLGLRSLNASCVAWGKDVENSASPVCQLIYTSVSDLRGDAFDQNTAEIFEQSASDHRKLALTGMLAADDGWYLQCLEGSPEAIAVVIDALLFDRRHRSMRMISTCLVPARRFAEWTMCSRGLSPVHEAILARIRGKLSLLHLNQQAALALLDTMAATARRGRQGLVPLDHLVVS